MILFWVGRFFGEIRWGTGGLITAYKEAAAEAIRNNEIVTCFVEEQLSVLFEYPLLNQVMRIAKEEDATIVSQRFDMDCEITLQIRRSLMERLKDRLSKLYSLRFVEG